MTLDDALALLNDEEAMDADQRTQHEIIGYRNAMTYIQQLGEDADFRFDESLIRSLHFMMLGHDLSKKPGRYRQVSIYVRGEDHGETVYEAPAPDDLPELMSSFVSDVQDQLSDPAPSYVTAAMAHLNLVMIHPFLDGNGRMARGLQTMILTRHQVLGQEFASIEEWLGRNTQDYYDILAKTGQGRWNPTRDTHDWIRFHVRAHHMQAQTVSHRVNTSNDLGIALTELVMKHGFNERTVEALYTAAQGLRLRRTTYQMAAEVEEVTANRDLKALMKAGYLEAKGQTRGRFYTGTPALTEIHREIRKTYQQRLVDPYQ